MNDNAIEPPAMGAPWVSHDRNVFVGTIIVGEVNPFGLYVGPKVMIAKTVRPLVIAVGFHHFPEAKRVVGHRRSRHSVLSAHFATQFFGSR
jgi:hypothetical protein